MTEAQGVPVTPPPTTAQEQIQVAQAKAALRPGWKTSEFYGAWAAKIIGALVTSGVLGDGTTASRIAGLAVLLLAQAGYTYSRTMIKTAAMLIGLLIMSNAMMACGSNAATRNKTISATLIAANVAEQAFVKFDADVQAKLVASATDLPSGEQALKDWRAKRGPIEDGIIALYRGIAVAATLNDDASLTGMLSALAILKQELSALGVTL